MRLDCLLGAGENEAAQVLIDEWLDVERDNLYARNARVDLSGQGSIGPPSTPLVRS